MAGMEFRFLSCAISRLRRATILGLILTTLVPGRLARGSEPSAARPVSELAAAIDRYIDARRGDVPVTPPVDDVDYLRRVSIDLIGRTPRVSEIREFLADVRSDRRARVVESLLATRGYITAMGNYYREALFPATNNPFFQTPGLNQWLDERVRSNTRYDAIVHEILSGEPGMNLGTLNIRSVNNGNNFNNAAARAFYSLAENKAENVTASAARLFLGVRLECAQCHDHPFASWSRKQFWESAAFFEGIGQRVAARGVPPPEAKTSPPMIRIGDTSVVVVAKFMDGTSPDWSGKTGPRKLFADWVIAPKNPYFAKVAVNRLWAHFFGQGLAEPIDDEITEENPASHPELLDMLAQEFVLSGYDLQHMIRAMTRTAAYQRSSLQAHPGQADVRLWARMPVRGMSAHQMFDSLAVAIGTPVGPALGGPRSEFLSQFQSLDRRTDKQTSILQALAMMNGSVVANATSLSRGATLGAIAEAEFMSTEQKLDTLFLAALGRFPRPEERERFESYIDRGGVRQDSNAALADVFWVLLNSSEFALNR